MTVTADEVRWAYRLFLGRDPENEQVIEDHRWFTDVAAMRTHFLACDEYRATEPYRPHLGAFDDAPARRVEIDAPPDALAAMLHRIGIAWSAFGETEPHWSVMVNDVFKHDRIEDNIDHFYATGMDDIARLTAMARRAGKDLSHVGQALDFGCGVGRLTLAIAPFADRVIGVDISPGHLKLARKRAAATEVDNTRFEQLVAITDLDRWRSAIDLVVSRIVLQHNPPPIMAMLLRRLLDCLAPGGTAIIQLPTYIADRDFAVAHYLASEQPQMEMNALPQRAVFAIIAECGCRPLEVREDDSAGDVPGVSQIFVIERA